MPGSQDKRNGVGHRSYRMQRERLKRQVERDGMTCHICKLPIDVSLPKGDAGSFEADHVVPLSKGGSLHKGELRASHKSCNARRGNKGIIDDPPVTKLY